VIAGVPVPGAPIEIAPATAVGHRGGN